MNTRSHALLLALAAAFSAPLPAAAQNNLFPQTLAPNTVVGRLGIGAGPPQAIPFGTLASQVFSDGLNISQSPSGTQAASLTLNNALILSTEALTGAAAFLNGQQITCGLQSTAVQGGLNCLYVTAGLNSPTNASNANRNYVAITGVAQANTGDGGTNTGAGAKGALFAANFLATAVSGATNLTELTGGEVDCSLPTGSSARFMMCWSIVSLANHAVHGASADYALAVGSQPGSVGFNAAFMLTGNNGIAPLAATGTIMGSDVAQTVAYGIDWRLVTCTTDYLAFLNVYTVDCSGNITSTGFISTRGAAIALSATAIPAGGTAAFGYAFFSTANFGIFGGSGAPTLAAAQGSLYLRNDGTGNTLLYSNTNGTTGWTPHTTGVGVSQTCTVNTASPLTLIFTLGLLTGGTCNT